jgi:hypothetical protein
MSTVRLAAAVLFVVLGWVAVTAQTARPGTPDPSLPNGTIDFPNEPARALKEGKVLHAARVSEPPAIDGALNDDVWTSADAATNYVQRDPRKSV